MDRKTFYPGEYIFREGDDGDTAYHILVGKVQVLINKNGSEISIAQLGPGDIFGEMAMIEDKPRSASIKAVEPTEVELVTEQDFYDMILSRPQVLIPYLASFFERLRQANEQLRRLREGSAATPPPAPSIPAPDRLPVITMRAANPDTAERVKNIEVVVDRFPYRIGRAGFADFDLFVKNELTIRDHKPFSVSRSHCSIERDENRIFVQDRGSRQGTVVNGTLIGAGAKDRTAYLRFGVNELQVGDLSSPYRFQLTLS